jgi:hypothetical protein
MTAARKTVSVAKLLHMANTYLASEGSTRDERLAIDTFISGVLHETGNYRGFAMKEGAGIPTYSADAPIRHYYFPSGTIADEYDAFAAKAA